ncbi:MAG: DUF2442 domain-containing protein [Verrucomicrobiota bacterium]|jgi:hypothetical protein|nr:DUF2442 domain-containing protein [Verrucomicrobiota bacterium]
MLTPKLVSVEAVDDCLLRLRYETGEHRVFNVTPYIQGGWFGQLGDAAYFRTVRVSRDGYGIEWPDGQDIAPHELYAPEACDRV